MSYPVVALSMTDAKASIDLSSPLGNAAFKELFIGGVQENVLHIFKDAQ